MNQTDEIQLPYPECEDPGNGALDLQVLAEAIDAKLVDQFARFRAVVNRPTFVFGLSAPQTGIVNGASSPGDTINFDTIVYQSNVQHNGPSGIFTIFTPGYWMLGIFCLATQSGGTTADAQMTTTMQITQDSPVFLGSTTVSDVSTRTYVSGLGNHHTVIDVIRQDYDGTVALDGGAQVFAGFWHANAASTVTIQSSSLIWGVKICDIEDL